MRTCKRCGVGLPPQTRGRPRELCDRCKPASRSRVVTALPPAATSQPAPTTDGPLVTQVRADLDAAGRSDTSAGQAAILLARTAEASHATAAGVAVALRELRATLALALAGAEKAADPVADLAARRAARAAGQ